MHRTTRGRLGVLVAAALFFAATPSSQAQYNAQSGRTADYTAALGGRFGTLFGVSGKVFLTENVGLEAHFGSRRRGFEMGMLGLWHRDIGWQGDFNWYFGGGAHLGFSEYDNSLEVNQRTQSTFGLDGVVGLEYTLRSIPLNLAIDYKPEVNFTGVTGPNWVSGAVTARYVFR